MTLFRSYRTIVATVVSALAVLAILLPLQSQAATALSNQWLLGEEENIPEGVPEDLWEFWNGYETPYEAPDQLMDAFNNTSTCRDAFESHAALVADETAYWQARVAADSEAATTLGEILDTLEELLIKLGENRHELEQEGEPEECEEDWPEYRSVAESAKIEMRILAMQIEINGDEEEITGEAVGDMCTSAKGQVKLLSKRVDKNRDRLMKAFNNDNADEAANATELLNVAESQYAIASLLMKQSRQAGDDTDTAAQKCSQAENAAGIGLALTTNANQYRKGDQEDDSSDVAHLDARMKLIMNKIATMRVHAFKRVKADRLAVLDEIRDAHAALIEVQKDFAADKYDDESEVDVESYQAALDDVEDLLTAADSSLDEAEKRAIQKKKRRTSSGKLIGNARKQIKKLRVRVNKKADVADTTDEQQILQFVEQGPLEDAVNSRGTSKAFKTNKKYMDAQMKAFHAIETAKAAQQVLTAIEK